MEKFKSESVEKLFEVVMNLSSIDECYKFFEDACTVKEILEIAQRLKAAKMLRAGKNYIEVCSETGMSSATISRVSKCLEYGAGGYGLALDRLGEKEI